MNFIPYFIAIPLAVAFIIAIIGKKDKGFSGILAALAAAAGAFISLAAAPSVMANRALVCGLGMARAGLGISMVVDSLSVFMLITVNLVAFMVAVYSIGYMKPCDDRWKFFALFSLMLAGMNGVLIAGDIFNLYVFMEVAAIAGYFLVAFETRAEELEAAFKYAVMGALASIFILLGIAILYSYASTLNMAEMARLFAQVPVGATVKFVGVLFLMGFGLKAALVPFHSWLPYAHSSAPAPVSAMLSGVSIKVLGIYALARIFFNVLGVSPYLSNLLIALAVLSMVVGGILAFGQSDIKRLFAYSSISQIGYIALGLGVGTPFSILGAVFHLMNHSIFKSLLFLNSGAIERMTGTKDLGKIRGIVSRDPVTGYTSLAGALSICGIPPLGGFWSKFVIILACIQAGRPFLALCAALVSILTLAYYFNALTPALFGSPRRDAGGEAGKKSWAMAAPMLVLAALSLITVIMMFPNVSNALLKGAASVLADGKSYADIVIMGGVR